MHMTARVLFCYAQTGFLPACNSSATKSRFLPFIADKLQFGNFVTLWQLRRKNVHFVAVYGISSQYCAFCRKILHSNLICVIINSQQGIRRGTITEPRLQTNILIFIREDFFMKHFSIRRIGKKLAALSMAAIASATMMLAAAPTASAINTADYTPSDSIIELPAPIYNWGNSNKILRYKVRLTNPNCPGGAHMRLMDKRGIARTNFLGYNTKQNKASNGGTLTPIGNNWYQFSIEVKNLTYMAYSHGSVPSHQDYVYYMPENQSRRQTLVYLENRGFYYKDIEIIENVDPNRNVSRFHVNQLNLSMNTMEDVLYNDPYHHEGADSVKFWKSSNKKIAFDFKPTNAHYYGNDRFTVILQTITETGSWKGIANTITVDVVKGECTLPGATVTTLSNGWKHIELPLNKFTVRNDQISNAATRTLDVVGFDWVNHSFQMRNFKVA